MIVFRFIYETQYLSNNENPAVKRPKIVIV